MTQTETLALIETLIAEQPQGIGIAALEKALAQRTGAAVQRRTLQRRLERLLKDRRIVAEGQSIALVYKPALPGAAASVAEAQSGAEAELYVPVSPEGAAVRARVRLPLMHRRPVGYQREFLEAYVPGVTFYLPESIRAQLHEMGRTPVGERPAGTYARDIMFQSTPLSGRIWKRLPLSQIDSIPLNLMNRLLVDLSWASSRLEGNTYSRLDTQNLIEFGQIAKGKDAQETQMILNHKAAIEMLIEDAEQVGFDAFTFQNLHAVLSQNLLREESACGRLRRRPVEISGTVFQPLAMPQALEDCFRLLLQKADAIPDPFEQAFFLMVQLPYLQPFEDVNKPVSRIGANISLIRHNLCPLSFMDVPERAYVEGTLGVYELNRVELLQDMFVWAYERSCQRYLAITQSMIEPDPLKIKYREALIEAVQAVVRGRLASDPKTLAQLAAGLASGADQAAFAQLLTDALRQLHEGSVARYRLKRSEFLAWKAL